MDGTGGKVNSLKSVSGIPVNDVFLKHGSKSQSADMTLCSLSEND